MTKSIPNGLTDVPGLQVGHTTDLVGLTGCTVVLCEEGAVAGVDQRGGAPGTRETDLLRPMHLVQKVHAVLLAGGSAFGLAAAEGVVRYLEERGVGFDARVAKVPIVPAAILFDLDLGDPQARPDAAMGYAACQAAGDGPVAEGNVGAGTGATAGKILGPRRAMKSGLGTAAVYLGGGLVVGALVAANPFGDVVDPQTGEILAGARKLRSDALAGTLAVMRRMIGKAILKFASSTVIGVVATNGRLTKEEANKVAQMAQDGIARAVRPAHTLFDGDTLFALSTGNKRADVNLIGAYGAEMVAQAVVRAVKAAEGAGGVPAWRDLR
ncbi:MAG TPA: peptidase S58 family protein [Anaerolineales bacterium]|nr:peptidase S58 family protein [Anaerolineae bacterium]HIQ00512.1 peptidase S58 family protein [Anaerolineales bacterium]